MSATCQTDKRARARLLTSIQVYLELLGDDSGMFDVSAGLLLSKMAHHSFDALKWSLYKKVGSNQEILELLEDVSLIK